MNMISTGAFQTEMDSSNKQSTLAEKFVAVWEKKNNKAARAGGVSLMALSLAACGSDDATTTTSTSSTTTTTTTTTTVDAAKTLTFTMSSVTGAIDNLTGGSGDDLFLANADGLLTTGDAADGGAGQGLGDARLSTHRSWGDVWRCGAVEALQGGWYQADHRQ